MGRSAGPGQGEPLRLQVDADDRICARDTAYRRDELADDTLPERILPDPAASGSAKGHVAELDKMLPEYYRLRGWDPGGVPESGTLSRLQLA